MSQTALHLNEQLVSKLALSLEIEGWHTSIPEMHHSPEELTQRDVTVLKRAKVADKYTNFFLYR